MKAVVSIIKALLITSNEKNIILNQWKFLLVNALSAPEHLMRLRNLQKSVENGIKVIIAGAGMAAHLPGVIAAMSPLPVIGVPIKASLDGLDSLLAIVQMPPGIPVATVAINGALNAGILAAQMLATNDSDMFNKTLVYKRDLKNKIVKANQDLEKEKFKFRVS